MVFGILLVLFFGGLLALIGRAALHASHRPMLTMLLGGYALRLVLSLGVHEIPFFSHAVGGDSQLYEEWALLIARIWENTSLHFVTAEELPPVGATALPPNLFALVFYVGGPDAHFGCVALVAFAAGLLCLNIYTLSLELGARERNAFLLTSLLYLSPLVLFYTSDSYKDGIVACFVMGALASAIRLSRKFSVLHAVLGVVSLVMLWYVRFYLVFVTTAPFFVGIAGVGSKSVTRPLLFALAALAAAMLLAVFTDILQSTVERASQTFQHGTDQAVLSAGSLGGSGVTFDDGGTPFGAFGPKLAYTLFAPFPWAGGSIGFQIGKLDALLWYFVMYRGVRGARQAWRTQPTIVVMILTFLLPCAFFYATSAANVGLIVRQRLAIVIATVVLAALYAPARQTGEEPDEEHQANDLRGGAQPVTESEP